jgi:hypothetical protein
MNMLRHDGVPVNLKPDWEGQGFTACGKTLGFVSGYRFSDTVSSSKSDAPLGAGHRISSFSASCLAVPQTAIQNGL